MKRLYIALFLFLSVIRVCVVVAGTPTLIANHGELLGPNGGTTSAINTTGANFIVINVANFNGVMIGSDLTDSKSNTWTALTKHQHATDATQQLFYCYNPTVGAGHTFTISTTSSSFSSITIAAFNNLDSSPFDVEDGTTAAGATTILSGSIIPGQNDTLVIAGLSVYSFAGATYSIDQSFIITDSFDGSLTPLALGDSMAYKVLTSSGTINPTWTGSATLVGAAAGIASFKYTAGGGPTPTATATVTATPTGTPTGNFFPFFHP